MAIAAALTLSVCPAGALAHGDPTAHYLETDSLLTTYAAPPDVAVELQLRGVLDAAAARGYPVKVALIASEEDTGGEPGPLEDTQDYAALVGQQLSSVKPLKAPVLIVTPRQIGIGGSQPRGGTLTPISKQLAASLASNLRLAEKPDGNALARAAMRAVRRLAATGGHTLPKRIPPAKNNLKGILSAASQRDTAVRGPWLIVSVLVA